MTIEKLLPPDLQESTPPFFHEPLAYDVLAEAPLLSNDEKFEPGRCLKKLAKTVFSSSSNTDLVLPQPRGQCPNPGEMVIYSHKPSRIEATKPNIRKTQCVLLREP